jgi:hypothetical protein
MYQFNSSVECVGSFQALWSQEEIKNEPMLFNCGIRAAARLGGPITKAFLDDLPTQWDIEDVVIDSRVHMLMPGWYPCIPGYHHDDVPRHKVLNGQPDYDTPAYKAKHLMGLVNGGICPTEFAIGRIACPQVPKQDVVYKYWHYYVEAAIELETMSKWKAPSGRYIEFDWNTFHQGTKAVANGWRWFIRVSCNTDRTKSLTNEVRRQAQVYLEFPMEGW